MAELKKLPRNIFEGKAPNIQGAAETYQALGDVASSGFKAIGEMVKANNVIEEKTLKAKASTDLERLQLQYSADPMLNLEKVGMYQQEANAIIMGYVSNAGDAYAKSLASGLEEVSADFTTKLMGDAHQAVIKNDRRDISLAINEIQNSLVKNTQAGDLEQAKINREDLASLLKAYYERGGSAKEIQDISDTTDTLVISSHYKQKLKNAASEQERTKIMQEMFTLDDTPVNAAAINQAWTEFGRLNKLYKEADSITGPLNNIATGQTHNNFNLPAKEADNVVKYLADKFANGAEEAPESPREMPDFEALPANIPDKPSDAITPDDVTEGIARDMQTPVSREPSLFELAEAHAMVGAKNATAFPTAVSNNLMAGDGMAAVQAATAIEYVYSKNEPSLELDSKTDTVYTEFKLMKDSGRTDYDAMIAEARNSVLKLSQTDLKLNTDIFNSSYSTTSGKGLENLTKAFKEATGNSNASTKALNDFYHIYRAKYLLADGKSNVALETAKREMARAHGSDKFSSTSDNIDQALFRPIGDVAASLVPTTELLLGLHSSDFEYVRFPPSKIMAGLSDTQIQNQLLEQIVFSAETNKNIILPEHYLKIKDAKDTEKMNNNIAYPPPSWSAELGDLSAAIYITQNIPEIGDIEGRVFLKSNNLTTQNNSGKPVWEVWMQDRMGRQFPVRDDSSPYNNTLLFVGGSAEDFAPEWAAKFNEDKLQKSVEDLLTREGRELYPRMSWNPNTIKRNYSNRKAYREELANRKRAEQKIKKILKGTPTEDDTDE